MKICLLGAVREDRQTDRHLNKLRIAFHNYPNAPKNSKANLHVDYKLLCLGIVQLKANGLRVYF